jgi:phosphoribosylamine--glycine ligase
MAENGYPDAPRSGDVIDALPATQADALVFHAGTRLEGDRLVTCGGRVLGVTALGDSVRVAQRRAYELVEQIHFDGAQYRHDIGWRAIARRH